MNLSSTPPTEATKPSTLLLVQTISSVSSRAEFHTNSALSTTTSILPTIFSLERTISKAAILTRRLPAVTFVAERLKVVLVPHEERIPLVRPDVVDVGRQLDNPALLTLNT